MKRLIKTSKRTRIKTPKAARQFERQFAAEMESMIVAMGRIYKNQAIKGMNATTVKKFADAQTGNFSSVFIKLSNATKRKLLKRFNNSRLEAIAAKYLLASDENSKRRLYAMIESKVGISAKELAATEGMQSFRNAMIKETAVWIQKTRDETLDFFTSNTLRAMTLGQDITTITDNFDSLVETRKGQARFVAQNQVNNFNSIMTKTRAQELGIQKARWITEQDDLVRGSHADRDGKVFDLAKGLYSSVDGQWLLPQVDYNCRCDYELILDDNEE